MDRDGVVNGFMRLATDEKVKNPESPKYMRVRAGEKGIGRFAAERLGHRLTMTTKPPGAKKALRVIINWDEFEAGREFFSVGSAIEQVDVDFPNGTVLDIENLRDGWSDRQVRQVWSYVASLLSPFPQPQVKCNDGIDPGFKTWFYREGSRIDEKEHLVSPDEFFKFAIAEIRLKIDDKGIATWSLQSRRYGNRKEEQIGLDREIPRPLPNAKHFSLRAYYYIRTSNLYPRGVFQSLNIFLRDQGGIRLYRNGYRVLPYGEPKNDWLGLDAAYRQRGALLAPIGNNNWLGYVEASDSQGELFQETSSREGLVENAAYDELVQIVHSTLISAARHIDNAREKERAKVRDRIVEKHNITALQETITKAKTLVDDMVECVPPKNRKAAQSARNLAKDVKETFDYVVRGFGKRIDAQAEEMVMLRILASMGMTIAEFAHEYGARAGAMRNDVEVISSLTSLKGRAKQATERLSNSFGDIEGFSEYFATTLRQNINRAVHPIELYGFAQTFVEEMRPLFGDRIVKVEVPEPADSQVLTTAMHPSEWSSILMNLMTNSRKAINRSETDNGRIMIQTGFLDDDTVYLTFADNGVGIPEEIHERIFEPFFTTTAGASAQSKYEDKLLGTGLGLKIVRDIVTGVRGNVEVITPPEGFRTAIRASVPAVTPEELDEIYED